MSFSEMRYGRIRKGMAKLTASQIDDKLNLFGCEPVLRDEIVERLAELDQLRAALQPFADAHREFLETPSIGEPWATPEDFARAAELIPPDNT